MKIQLKKPPFHAKDKAWPVCLLIAFSLVTALLLSGSERLDYFANVPYALGSLSIDLVLSLILAGGLLKVWRRITAKTQHSSNK